MVWEITGFLDRTRTYLKLKSFTFTASWWLWMISTWSLARQTSMTEVYWEKETLNLQWSSMIHRETLEKGLFLSSGAEFLRNISGCPRASAGAWLQWSGHTGASWMILPRITRWFTGKFLVVIPITLARSTEMWHNWQKKPGHSFITKKSMTCMDIMWNGHWISWKTKIWTRNSDRNNFWHRKSFSLDDI